MGKKQSYDNYISQNYVSQNGSLEGLFPGCPPADPGTFLPPASFFNATELFTPIGTDANALGLYKPWFLGRGSLIRLRAVGTITSYSDTFRKVVVHGSNWAPDPDNC